MNDKQFAAELSEEKMVGLVRNALLVVGQEMGETGDHWPVINSTIYSFMQDWENLKVERNVHEEMRTHLYASLDRMDTILLTCADDVKADAGPKLIKLREIYDAHFTPVDPNSLSIDVADLPEHVRRAQNILMTLEDDQ